ncbi:MAG: substrate-binding domain-containing protein [Spirochaetota bacterium]
MKKSVVVLLVLLFCLTPLLLFAGGGKKEVVREEKFREVPLSWILDLEEELSENILTPEGPNGEPITSAERLELSDEEIRDARELDLGDYLFMAATLDITEILNKEGMDDVLATVGKQPIKFLGADSISEQIEQVNSMAARAGELSFIVAQAFEAETTGPAFVELARAGVPQLHNWTTPRGLSGEENYIGLVDADGYGQGAAAARILSYMMGEEGKVGIIYFALEQWTNVMRLRGAEETFAQYPGIEVVAREGFTDPAQGRDIALGMLQANPDIDAIWATWMDGPATGAAEAVLELGRVGEVIVAAPDLGGIPGARFIADTNHPIVGAGAADTIEMGENSIRAALKWHLGKKDEVRGIYTASHVIPIVRTNLVDGFNKQTRGTLGNLPREVLEMLE